MKETTLEIIFDLLKKNRFLVSEADFNLSSLANGITYKDVNSRSVLHRYANRINLRIIVKISMTKNESGRFIDLDIDSENCWFSINTAPSRRSLVGNISSQSHTDNNLLILDVISHILDKNMFTTSLVTNNNYATSIPPISIPPKVSLSTQDKLSKLISGIVLKHL